MRILAIRGKNLASLAGPFEIDFQAAPLADAGLFALCGPTGAGKSTLLDALCLALYDDTPRLKHADGRGIELPDVGKETTLPNDRRNILRRGCGEGFAEVDFAGNDGIAYRARWSVRRARGKPDGKLQAAELALTRLADGQPVAGHTKGEVQRAIVERVGLSFEQFTRAVLLAQNEFFTFLKAGEDERAALLQTLTGTDRFEQISRRAFERNKQEQETLRALRERLADQQPLAAEARAAQEQEHAASVAAATTQAAHEQRLAARLRWHEELDRARAAEAAAQTALEAASTRQAEAAPRRIALARIESAQPVRPLVAEVDRLAAEQQACAAQHAQAERAVAAAHTQRDTARRRHAAAHAALTAIEASAAQFAPRLIEARALDTQLATLTPQRHRAAQAHSEAGAALARAQQALTANSAAQQAQQQALTRAEAWLAQHAAHAALAEHWPRWDALFTAAAAAQREDAQAAAEHARLQDEAAHGQQRLAHAAADYAAAADTLRQRENDAASATLAAQAFDPEALAQRRSALDHRRSQTQDARECWRQLCDQRAQAAALAAEAETLRANADAAHARLAQLAAARPPAEAAAQQAEQSWRIVQQATGANAEALRASLVPHTPCPVCGATEHPYASAHPALDHALAQLAAERDRCQAAANALAVEQQALERELATVARQRTQLAPRQQALTQALALLAAAWSQHVARLAAPEQPDLAAPAWPRPPVGAADGMAPDAAISDWLAHGTASVAAALTHLAQDEARQREAAARQRAAQQALDAARRNADRVREICATHERTATRCAEALRAAHATQASAAARLAELLTQLDAAHPEPTWRSAWHADPAAHQRSRHDAAAEWLRQRDAARSLHADIERLAAESRGLNDALAQASAHHEQAARALAAIDAQLATLHAARSAVFTGMWLPAAPDQTDLAGHTGHADPAELAPALLVAAPAQAAAGLSVAAIEAALGAAVEAARAQLSAAAHAVNAATEAHAGAAATLTQLAGQREALTQAAQRAAAALTAWLDACHNAAPQADSGEPPLDLPTLRALLAHEAGWCAAERQALAALDQQVASANGALTQARAQRAAHQANGAGWPPAGEDAPADTPEALHAALADLRAAHAALREKLGAIELALRQDDAIRHKAAELVQAVAAQEAAARIWAQLNELIGSADGKKFRNYAQQLSLDILLAYANAHLKDLARRYRLERVPGSLALMVLDHDMGNEQRSVHSLSGGESFLVSLALALGLASLSSHRVRVESLFIDEGFGSLDADTLRVAMDALDSLQAMGRKVGVISHVEEMTERIATRIHVRRLAGGQSRVEISGPGRHAAGRG